MINLKFRLIVIVVLFVVSISALAVVQGANTGSLTFKAFIDGKDYVYVQGGGATVWYYHVSNNPPGYQTDVEGEQYNEENHANNPTYIDGKAWTPSWPSLSSTAWTNIPSYSDKYINPSPHPSGEWNITSMTNVISRGTLRIEEYPSASNGYTAKVLIDDYQGGAYWTSFTLNWETQSSLNSVSGSIFDNPAVLGGVIVAVGGGVGVGAYLAKGKFGGFKSGTQPRSPGSDEPIHRGAQSGMPDSNEPIYPDLQPRAPGSPQPMQADAQGPRRPDQIDSGANAGYAPPSSPGSGGSAGLASNSPSAGANAWNSPTSPSSGASAGYTPPISPGSGGSAAIPPTSPGVGANAWNSPSSPGSGASAGYTPPSSPGSGGSAGLASNSPSAGANAWNSPTSPSSGASAGYTPPISPGSGGSAAIPPTSPGVGANAWNSPSSPGSGASAGYTPPSSPGSGGSAGLASNSPSAGANGAQPNAQGATNQQAQQKPQRRSAAESK